MYSTPPPFVTTTDDYQYLSCPGTSFIQALIQNAGVVVGYGTMTGSSGPEAANYPMYDQTMLPGSFPVPQRCDAIRFKSMTPGVPAQIQIVARPNSELPEGVALQTAYVPSYLLVNPDGTIGANFTGHIQALALDLPSGSSFTNPESNSRITWTDRASGVQDGSMFAAHDAVAGTSWLMLGTRPTNGEPRGGLLMTTSAGLVDSLQAFFSSGVQPLIMNSRRVSGFLNWGPGNAQRGEQCQMGSFTVNSVPVGNSTQIGTFVGGPWPTSATNAFVWVKTAANGTTTVRNCGANGLTGVYVNLDNTVVQNISFGYLAFGQ